MRTFQRSDVKEKFQTFPQIQGKRLLELREMVFDVAEADCRIGALSEQLRWGDPSYITEQSGAGSTLRLGLFGKQKIAVFFNCKTTLVESFRQTFADRLEYSKNRAVVLDPEKPLDKDVLSICMHRSLTYKLKS